jgi:hypothetical protein
MGVALEAIVRFPWSGGRHPCLDAFVETGSCLIGIESKRYEPFRTKSTAPLSDAYWRPVWGDRMRGYEAVRDLLRKRPDHFRHLGAAQLVKHAFGLRTASQRLAGKQPVLAYVYAEPPSNPFGTSVTSVAMGRHRAEIQEFAHMVDGDEVRFVAFAYADLIASWFSSPNLAVHKHAVALDAAFFGLFQGVKQVWKEHLRACRSGAELAERMFAIIDANWQAARRARAKLPSRENWRWPCPFRTLSSDNTSPEVRLERTFIEACERRRQAADPPAECEWANQVPVASGVRTSGDRRRAIDLIYRRGPQSFELIELKVGSDDPSSAALQLVEYGILWLLSRRDRLVCKYKSPLIEANDIRLCVLAPPSFYGTAAPLRELNEALNAGLRQLALRNGVRMSFAFQVFPAQFTGREMHGDAELIRLFEDRRDLV